MPVFTNTADSILVKTLMLPTCFIGVINPWVEEGCQTLFTAKYIPDDRLGAWCDDGRFSYFSVDTKPNHHPEQEWARVMLDILRSKR